MFASNLRKDQNFKRLDPSIKDQILKQIKQNPRDAAGLDQLKRLATDPNFGKISKDVQKKILDTIDQLPIEIDTGKPGNEKISVDKARDQLRQLATDGNFAKLSPEAQKIALDNLAKAPDKEVNLTSVKEGAKAGVLLESNPAFRRLDPDTKKQVLELAGQNGLAPSAREQLIKLATTPDLKNPSAASAYVGGLTYDQLKELTNTGSGKLLQSIEKELKTANPSQFTRLQNAKKAAMAEASEEFDKLSPNGKNAVRSAFEKSQFNTDSTANISLLVYVGNLDKLSDSTQKKMLDATAGNANPAVSKAVRDLVMDLPFKDLGERTQNMMLDAAISKSGDPAFLKSLKGLTYNPAFSKAGETARAKVVADLLKFTGTQSYMRMLPIDREPAMEIISRLSVHSAANPAFVVARNTLDKLVNGNVPMELYRDPNDGEMGKASKGVMKFNASSALIKVFDSDLISTAAHEVNHVLNGHTPAGTPNRFLDEYRAWWVGDAAIGENPPRVDTLKETLRNLATNAPDGSGYDHLRKLYRNDAQFRKVVDEIQKDLNANPPKITTPEQLRLKMKDFPRTDYGTGAGAGSDKDLYLNTPGNEDNR
jgi:hypothetical protein